MQILPYNRPAAVSYARKWALSRNPVYYDFENVGGDCTSFVSQSIYAGTRVMNFTPVTGWYYRTSSDRTASWSGVDFLYQFLINNKGTGPFAHTVTRREVQIGDIVQLGKINDGFYHSALITQTTPDILVAAHSLDSLNKPLDAYIYEKLRFIHIDGARQ